MTLEAIDYGEKIFPYTTFSDHSDQGTHQNTYRAFECGQKGLTLSQVMQW